MRKFLFAVILAFAFSLPLNKLHEEELVELAEKAETVEYGRWILNISCNGFPICPWESVRRRVIPGTSTSQFRIQPIPDPTGCLVRHNQPNINQLQISDDGGQTWRFAGGSSLICSNIGMTFVSEFEETEAPTAAPAEEEEGETCEDTPSWSNGEGHDCLAYESTMEWCADGAAIPGKEWALGSNYNYPENNCCACGKGWGQEISPKNCYEHNGGAEANIDLHPIVGTTFSECKELCEEHDSCNCITVHRGNSLCWRRINCNLEQCSNQAGVSVALFHRPPLQQPTAAPPTAEPTAPPTEPPTEAPTQPPTEAPTEAPTEPPTEAPAEEEEEEEEDGFLSTGDSQCERTDGRCGPLFDDAKCSGTPAYAIYCNTDNGWCGNTNAHRYAQLGSEYDLSSCGTDEALVEKAEETGDHPQPKLKLPVDQRPNQVMWYPPRAPCNRDTHLEKGNYPIVGYVHYGGHQVFIQKYNGYNRVFEKRSYSIAGTPQGAVELGFYDGDYIYTKYDSQIQFFGTPEGAEKKGTVSGCNNDDEKGAAAAVTLIKMQQEIEKRHQMG